MWGGGLWGGGGGLSDAANLLYGLILRYFRHLRVDPDIWIIKSFLASWKDGNEASFLWWNQELTGELHKTDVYREDEMFLGVHCLHMEEPKWILTAVYEQP